MDALEFKICSQDGAEYMIVLDGDYDGEWLSSLPWHVLPNGYVHLQTSFRFIVTDVTGQVIGYEQPVHSYLHQWILPPKKGYWIKHLNGNNLDNRSCNLAYIRPQDSALRRPLKARINQFGYRGVRRQSSKAQNGKTYVSQSRWNAYCNKKYLGSFSSVEDAARAYDVAAIKKWGNRAPLNFKET